MNPTINKKEEEPKAEEKTATETVAASPALDKVDVKIVTPVEETVTINKSELAELMDRLKRVEFAAEKSRLANFDEKNKKQGNKKVKIRVMNDKVILSWDEMINDTVEKNENGVWKENQIVRINFEDKTSEEYTLGLYVRRYKTILAEVISRSVENQGTENEATILKVRTEDGKEYLINKKFVN